ncbi:hypothetical protein F5Y09DRAFT_351990 [Xylaria sp. FL1042]|nr:hypothetical protein F5Y09DRAFT_351990 [Xylaria sp. FL1042]
MSQKGGTYQLSLEAAEGIQADSSFQPPVHKLTKLDEQEHTLDKSDPDNSGLATYIAESNNSTRAEPGKKAKHSDEKLDDNREWELVNIPEEGEQDRADSTSARRFESHFDFTVGQGRWKLTLFSWDIKVERPQVKWH